MTALAQLQKRLREVTEVLDAKIAVTTTPGNDGGLHVRPRGDRFDLMRTEKGATVLCRPLIGQEETAFELAFEATRSVAQAAEARTRGPVYCRWNWMGPHMHTHGSGRADLGRMGAGPLPAGAGRRAAERRRGGCHQR